MIDQFSLVATITELYSIQQICSKTMTKQAEPVYGYTVAQFSELDCTNRMIFAKCLTCNEKIALPTTCDTSAAIVKCSKLGCKNR